MQVTKHHVYLRYHLRNYSLKYFLNPFALIYAITSSDNMK